MQYYLRADPDCYYWKQTLLMMVDSYNILKFCIHTWIQMKTIFMSQLISVSVHQCQFQQVFSHVMIGSFVHQGSVPDFNWHFP